MRIVRTTAAALLLMALAAQAHAQVDPTPPPATPQQPGTVPQPGTTPQPGVPPQQPGGVVPTGPVPPPVVGLAPVASRRFTAKTGMIFQSVRPERIFDFETVIGYLQDALKKSTDPAVLEQAQGWRVFKATEPGPNGTVLYVFVFDPAIPGADYGLGAILADAYPDKIQEIWKLYQGSLAPSATLLNLTPVEAPPPAPPGTLPAPTTTPAPARPGPPPPTTTPAPVRPDSPPSTGPGTRPPSSTGPAIPQ